MQKICSKCKLNKDLKDYYPHKLGKLKTRSRCISCFKKEVKDFKKINVVNVRSYHREYESNRRINKNKAFINLKDKENLRKFYKDCPKGMHIDHIIPLKNDNVCGLHVSWNLQYLIQEENSRKCNFFDFTYENLTWRS